MPSFALIGLGDNSKNLHQALLHTPGIHLAAVCDIDPDAVGGRYYDGIPRFCDYKNISIDKKPDYYYIATDPESHYEIAAHFLKNKCAVLCEKPATGRFDEYLSLRRLAEADNTFFNIVYHFRFSNEVLWLRDRLASLGSLKSARVLFNDPYYHNSRIVAGREKLLGCWFDSASNILSAFSFLFDDFSPSLVDRQFETDPVFDLPIKASVRLEWNGALIEIKILWGEASSDKQMRLNFENGDVILDFTQQKVWLNGKQTAAFGCERSAPAHYCNFFAGFEAYKAIPQSDRVTRFLYEV